jgi:hypothetical protein
VHGLPPDVHPDPQPGLILTALGLSSTTPSVPGLCYASAHFLGMLLSRLAPFDILSHE